MMTDKALNTVGSIIAEFSRKYLLSSEEIEKTLQAELAAGTPLRQAVNKVFTDKGIEQSLLDSISNAQVAAVGLALDIDITVGENILREALNRPWTGDGMKLSKRLHGATQAMRSAIIETIAFQQKIGSKVIKTARALYDGYGYGSVMRRQQLPQYLHELISAARRLDLNPDDRAEFNAALRKAKRLTDNMSLGGAPNRRLKATYKQLIEAAEKSQKAALDKAIYAAVEEKSRYIAERIARTEAARAYFDGIIAKYQNDPDVAAYRWRLGIRHPVFDICDMYAKADLCGLGAGIFPKDKLPAMPAHPHCMCRLSPVFVIDLRGKTAKDNIELGGSAWLQGLPDDKRRAVLGVDGANAVKTGANWQGYMRGWGGLKTPVSRLAKKDLLLSAEDDKIKINLKEYGEAYIPITKLTMYALNPEKDINKAKAFEQALGYNLDNIEKLINNIKQNINKFDSVPKSNTGFGERFQITMELQGENGKTASVLSAWIVDLNNSETRLTSLYVKKRK